MKKLTNEKKIIIDIPRSKYFFQNSNYISFKLFQCENFSKKSNFENHIKISESKRDFRITKTN
jgi:hypothetical protein